MEIIEAGCLIALGREFIFEIVADDANFRQILPSGADDEEAHQAGSTSEIGFGGGAGCHAPKS